MDINKEIQAITDKLIQEKLPSIIEEKISKLLSDLLGDIFRSYSDVGKQIKSQIEQKLDVNLQNLELLDYNVFIANIIKKELEVNMNDSCVEPIKELVKKTVGYVSKKEINLSEIYDKIIEDSEEHEVELTFIVEEHEEYDWTIVYISPDEIVEKRDCLIEFCINKEGKIFTFATKDYWNKKQTVTPFMLGRMRGIESYIFKLYSAQVKINIDETEFYHTYNKHS